jgi:hypothetical protein
MLDEYNEELNEMYRKIIKSGDVLNVLREYSLKLGEPSIFDILQNLPYIQEKNLNKILNTSQ